MKYLLNTNVISETIRTQPDTNVQRWFKDIPSEALYISVLTLGEIRKTIEKTEDGSNRKNKLVFWLEQDLPKWFGDNILPISQEIAGRWVHHCFKEKSHSRCN